jgi:hypothetical protein
MLHLHNSHDVDAAMQQLHKLRRCGFGRFASASGSRKLLQKLLRKI